MDVLTEHVQKLSIEIGPRPVGSAGNTAAAEYIRQTLTRFGLHVEEQPYPCPDWKHFNTQLSISGAQLPATANPFSPACNVNGVIEPVGTLEELQRSHLEGKIVLLYGALTRQGLTPSYAVYAFEPDPVAELLKAKQPLAVVCVSPRLGYEQPLIEDWDFPIPSVTVPARAGLGLIHRHDRPVQLQIDSHRAESSTRNVVGRMQGAHEERIVVCAHFDTKPETPGAFDNGSGTAVLLGLAQAFSGQSLKCGLELVAFSGEETGGTDFTAYQQFTPDIDQIKAVINIDGVGQKLGVNSVTVMGASEQLERIVRQVKDEYSDLQWVEPWYESDHSAFLWRGIPCIPLSSAGSAEITHGPEDTIDWIEPARLAQAFLITVKLIEQLQDCSSESLRPPASP
jgi:Iap family predicted aminopeptidase